MSSVVDIHKKNGKRPEFDVYIGRAVRFTEFTESTKWSNPNFSLEDYEKFIRIRIKKYPNYFDLEELRGKKLGCWCITTDKIEPVECHGQILMKLLRERDIV